MTFKVKKIIFLCLFSLNVNAGERWAIDCVSGKGSIIIEHDKADVIVNTNQIVVSTRVVKTDDKLSFFLEEPADLGRGGMMLNWDDFSNSKPIADAQKNGDIIKLSWKGFFESSTLKYVWVSDSEFTAPKNEKYVIMKKCE